MTARPRLPRSSFMPPSLLKGSTRRAAAPSVAAHRGCIAPGQALRRQPRLLRVTAQPLAHDRAHIRMHEARVQQFAHQETHAARGMEVIHVGGAIRIDPRQQRHDV